MAKALNSFLPRQERSNDWRSRWKQEKAENSKTFRNYCRVFDRVSADGAAAHQTGRTAALLDRRGQLERGPVHGFGIAQSIHHLSEDVLQVEDGSLYPALQRMLIKGWAIDE